MLNLIVSISLVKENIHTQVGMVGQFSSLALLLKVLLC